MSTSLNRDIEGSEHDPRVIGEELIEQIKSDKLGQMTAGQEVVVSHELIDEIEAAVKASSETDPEQIIRLLETQYYHYRDINKFLSPDSRKLVIKCIEAFRGQIPVSEQSAT